MNYILIIQSLKDRDAGVLIIAFPLDSIWRIIDKNQWIGYMQQESMVKLDKK